MNPEVIDMSHYQPDPINWGQLKASGTVGVIHKATEGEGYLDDKLFSRAKAALAAGLCWSTYHFLRPGNIEGQVDFYLDTIKPVKGERVCLDHEDERVTLDDLENAVRRIIERRPDLQITIYSGHLIKDQLKGQKNVFLADFTSLWIAQYTSAESPDWPYQVWPAWSLWQYTDKATAVGVTGNVDGNRWNGSDENLLKWFGPSGQAPQPASAGAVIDITTTGDVVLTVSVNGRVLK
jgi:GH25 family lysozyme M1 (1,4-beta-N-acetylmuramidase)